MKVLFLTHSFPRFPGDAPGSFLLRLAVALRAEGVRVHVLAPAAEGLPQHDEFEGVSVERFRYAPSRMQTLAYTGNMAQDVASSWGARLAMIGYLGANFARAAQARRQFGPDVVHAHWWFPSGLLAAALPRASRIPLMTTMHGTDVRLARSVAMSRPVFRGVLRRSSRATTVSRWLAAEVEALAPGVIPTVAPMPVAIDRFRPHGGRESQRFLFAGRLNRQKGLDHLVRAFARMRHSAMLDVVGEGNRMAELRALTNELGVGDKIVWHGQVTQERLAGLYQAATAVVVPSTDEGLGLVAVEALLCETPVIAYRSGGLTDVIQHERTGILVTPEDIGGLSEALDRVLESPGAAAAWAQQGRLFALSAFAPESAAKQYAGMYREMIAKRAA